MSDGEALLGSVFESCDVNNEGKVRVSVLIEYLLKEAAADDNKEVMSFCKIRYSLEQSLSVKKLENGKENPK